MLSMSNKIAVFLIIAMTCVYANARHIEKRQADIPPVTPITSDPDAMEEESSDDEEDTGLFKSIGEFFAVIPIVGSFIQPIFDILHDYLNPILSFL